MQSLSLTHEDLPTGMVFKGVGCHSCFGSGFKGRHGLHEMMIINNAIKKQIVKSPDAVEIRQISLESGMTTLSDHGRELVSKGFTTIAEVLRVTKGAEERG
jgi:general secretion pathway protein E